MVDARRAAPDDSVAELGLVAPARRAAPIALARPRLARLVVAPIAILSVVGLAAGLMVAPQTEVAAVTEPAKATVLLPLGISRSQPRAALATPTPSPSPSPSPTASPSPAASPSVAAVVPGLPIAPTPAPTPTPSPAETTPAPAPSTPPPPPEKPAAPKIDYAKLGAEAGTRYSTASVNVRTGPGVGFDVRTSLAQGKAVTITDREIDGWRQVVISDRSGWIKGSFLTKTAPPKPTAKATAAETTSADGGQSSASSSAPACAKASGIESGLTSRTRSVLRAVCAAFPGVSSYGGRRAGGGSYHSSGQAIDVMVSGEYGWQIARWARANAGSLGIIEVIYSQKIWTAQRSGDGWRSMSDRGSASANHYDHVHISVR